MLQKHYFAAFGLLLLTLWSFTHITSNHAAEHWLHGDRIGV
jgi:hypothetical protein